MKKIVNKMFLLIGLSFLIMIGFVSCEPQPEPQSQVYNVSFNTNGGSTIVSHNIASNEKVTKPTDPIKDWYVFAGWYLDDSTFSNEWDFNTLITENKILYAKWREITVGDKGPSGGYIFYDDELGFDWDIDGTIEVSEKNLLPYTRYLAAAPVGWLGLPSDSSAIFGFIRDTDDGINYSIGTSTEIGTGKANTDALILAMGDYAYNCYSGSYIAVYSAKLSADCSVVVDGVTYDDWFLPSRDALSLMYVNLAMNDIGGFSNYYYWSSSEVDEVSAWSRDFENGVQNNLHSRINAKLIRPIRAF